MLGVVVVGMVVVVVEPLVVKTGWGLAGLLHGARRGQVLPAAVISARSVVQNRLVPNSSTTEAVVGLGRACPGKSVP
jgi:hypothetical protein